ncbi:zinc-dependent metalloprotease [Allorhodopirellula solitaria]|uniref:DUF5117 domain-containing protein n=1 Tax=Allorhodopirellula solitaria TaxID=2527987 RepID=A0A5C5X2G7_9BACT|nr:zinc-dependent metalloprotease [Allorhodopirellula solitaria]TWT56365.1 hypothetical protein CA85_43680 [Allorhodopirellula solitaria]
MTRIRQRITRLLSVPAVALVTALPIVGVSLASPSSVLAASLPEFSKVSEGFEKVDVSDQQSDKGLFNVWKRDKDSAVIGELPKNFKGKSYFVALTLSSGDRYAGLQSGDWVVQWRRYDDRMALVVPNLSIRATGDAESKASVKRLFTDTVLLDVPILAIGPSGGPVIDMDSLLISNASKFFGRAVRITNSRLYSIESCKVFPKNVELAFEVVGSGGLLQTLHYSFSEVPGSSSGYKSRKADERVGFFTTSFSDLSVYEDEDTRVRFINRWHLEKRDPKLKLSPPKEPIRFYVEHTAPVRYRRWIKAGIDYWNKAFEKVGIVDAIVVEYQDAVSKIHMEKDPEDVRYNFVRWLNNDVGTAIGPSRVHPETGQILDADIILTDGWIRHFNFNYADLMPNLAMEGVSAETLAWLGTRPNWDPRVRMGAPEDVHSLRAKYARQAASPMAGYKMAQADPALLGDEEFDGLIGHVSQKNGLCMAASGRSMDLALARMDWALSLHADTEAEADKKKEEEKKQKEKDEADKKAKAESGDESESGDKSDGAKKDEDESESDAEESLDKKGVEETVKKDEDEMLDGMPEWFVGPLLADLVAHEVGHTLGLRHNFKASSLRTLEEINSKEVKGNLPFASSVMDYNPINYRYDIGDVQGDYTMIDIGPYDYWAIEYGYTMKDSDLEKILKRCSEPELQYATDEDTSGPDPYARRYDFAKDPLAHASEQMKLVELYRGRLLDKFVKDGDSWAKARRGYELTLGLQMRSVSMMANWIGGAFVNRDKKGDPGNRVPVEVVAAEDQRDALEFVIETTFRDEAYGLTPEILERLGVDKWLDGGSSASISAEATWPIHDRVLDMQASALTLLMNPTTLRRVYDNEMRLRSDADALTLPELLSSITSSVWTELDQPCPEGRNDRKPMISSLRRNLQREHLQRLVDLILEDSPSTAAYSPITNLARMELRALAASMESTLKKCEGKMDAYTLAHLTESKERITRALEAGYTYGGNQQGAGLLMMLMGRDAAQEAAAAQVE